jgi:hypothetical protein
VQGHKLITCMLVYWYFLLIILFKNEIGAVGTKIFLFIRSYFQCVLLVFLSSVDFKY